jgi:DNA-binding NtrC family response regulator
MDSQEGTSLELPELLGEDSRFLDALKRARKVALLEAPVFLSGETGTGKGLLARWIHFFSQRREKPFDSINCGNFTAKESLLESELFGCEAGAFTDAKEKRKGLVEEASLGTLFLDEIDTLSSISQEKLLHFLEHQTFRRVGGTEMLRVDARLICAANVDLERLVAEGRFRKDLFYRLNAFPIFLPPLRERGNDVLLIAKRFFLDLAKENPPPKQLTPEAEEVLLAHSWDGNVRELETVCKRLVVWCESPIITKEDVLAHLEMKEKPPLQVHFKSFRSLNEAIREVEIECVRQVLERAGGQKVLAAERLGISFNRLQRILKRKM